jgi:hypothetical protein
MRERLRDRWAQAEPIQRRLVVATIVAPFWIVLAVIREDDERTWALWAVGFAFGAFALAAWAAVDAAKRSRLAEREAARMIGLLESIDRKLAETPRSPEDEPGAPHRPVAPTPRPDRTTPVGPNMGKERAGNLPARDGPMIAPGLARLRRRSSMHRVVRVESGSGCEEEYTSAYSQRSFQASYPPRVGYVIRPTSTQAL